MAKLIVLISSAAMLLGIAPIFAQVPAIFEFPSTDPAVLQNASPRSVVNVKMTIRKEIIRSGPYARYAQRLLGVMAPLTDKNIYSIESASISIADPTREQEPVPASSLEAVSLTRSDTSFTAVTPDRMQVSGRSQEELARDAANAIFRLRKQRLDLVSGEMGERVFGQGLGDALAEIDRLENEYLSLFVGKYAVQTFVREYGIVPSADKLSYVVARFSESAGVLPESDLSGNPIMLVMKPETPTGQSGSSKSRAASAFRVPGMVTCRVMNGAQELSRSVLPVFQFGMTVESMK